MTAPGTVHAIRPTPILVLILGLIWMAAWSTAAAADTPGPNRLFLPLISSVANTSPSNPTCLAAIPCQASSNESYEVDTQNRINGERRPLGVSALAVDGPLVQIARFHSRDMATHNYFDHNGLNEKWSDRFQWTGEKYSGMGEIIAEGYSTPQAVVKAWMASPGHHAIIVDPGYTVFGGGYVTGSGAYSVYWTVDFAVARTSASVSIFNAFGRQPPDCETWEERAAQGDISALVCR
jgi:uncharacterized protein YkwD